MAGYLDSGAANRPPAHPALRDRGMKEACRGGFASAVRLAMRLGASVSAVPIALVAPGATPVTLVGGAAEANPNPGEPVVIKALTLQLAAKARQIDTFAHRVLIRLVTQGRDAPDLLRLFFPSGPNAPVLARQLSQEMRDEALLALLEGYNSPFSSQDVDEYIGFAGALLDTGASPNRLHGSRVYPTSALSAAVKTLSPDLVRFFLDCGACPDGPPSPPARPIASPHAPAQATLRHIADMLLERGADINTGVPYVQHDPDISFTNPLLVFLDTIDCWDDDEDSRHALDALKFLLDRGASPDGPPRHPAFDATKPHAAYPDFFRSGRYTVGRPRVDPLREVLEKWGTGPLALPAFASALALSSSSPSQPTPNGEAILGAWTRLISMIARHLTPHELGEFLHAYVVRMGTCLMSRRNRSCTNHHQSASHEMGDLAKATVTVLLATGADMNRRLSDRSSWSYHDDPNREWMNGGTDLCLTPLHAICIWLAGRAHEETPYISWFPSCRGLRHSPRRTAFIRFLIETCGADRGATYLGRTPAEMLVQLRRPELDKEETVGFWWRTDPAVVEEGRRALLAVLENASGTT
ncbi:hypothetical protein C8A05DRAFT_45626 [Staphylotrichum tortipilum]|uniref:Ankyrin repeat protein n=1 Tax=Staphylotrichum tortipilum TaxID=2831512 RepID=A0AAN6RS70_9PEZI|nr:hypothetical protein C8A05DRAFT_45626 [Staphylotrichum longicolle]